MYSGSLPCVFIHTNTSSRLAIGQNDILPSGFPVDVSLIGWAPLQPWRGGMTAWVGTQTCFLAIPPRYLCMERGVLCRFLVWFSSQLLCRRVRQHSSLSLLLFGFLLMELTGRSFFGPTILVAFCFVHIYPYAQCPVTHPA